MPWWVTQSMASSASRRSRLRRRTVWTPGTTRVPLPVTIRKPRPSDASSGFPWSRRPEMMSASFGSATRHMERKTMKARMIAPSIPPAITSAVFTNAPPVRSQRGDDDGARWQVLQDQHLAAGADLDVPIHVVRVERFGAAADRHHDLTEALGADAPRHAAGLADHSVICHLCPTSS